MKTIHMRSVLPIYFSALSWILYGLVRPLYRGLDILMATGICVAVYLLTSRFFPGKKIEVETAPNTGDKDVDTQIREGREALAKLREANERIPDAAISSRLERMDKAGRAIFDAVAKDTRKAVQVRKFMNYYLPTTVKLMDAYRTLQGAGGGENVDKTKSSIENSLEMVALAFEKQLDNLYRGEALDITTDIQVLETMLAGEGLAQKDSQKA